MTKKTTPPHYIHYDPERVEYSVTESEMVTIERGNSSLWKDICLVAFSIALATGLNAI
jgi:hypothetical protein